MSAGTPDKEITGKKIGIIGGMGPAATLLFYEMIIDHTVAACDQEHIDMIVLNHATMPDRTRALLSGKRELLLAGGGLADALAAEAEAQARTGATADHRAATNAFVAKQRPKFTGS
jgi:aspartate/glutamate racemase